MRWNVEAPYRCTWTTHERGPGYRYRTETFETEAEGIQAMRRSCSPRTIKIVLDMYQAVDIAPKVVRTRGLKR